MMIYRKSFLLIVLTCLLIGTISAQSPRFRIIYQWFPGPGSIDTLKVYTQSVNADTVNIDAVNFSLYMTKPCDSMISWSSFFSSLWASNSFFEITQVDPINITINGISYNCRWQYAHQGSSFLGFLGYYKVLPNTVPPQQVAEFVFARTCTNKPYWAGVSDNPLNQWADQFGYTPDSIIPYEVIPISVLSNIDLELSGKVESRYATRLNWRITNPEEVYLVKLYCSDDEEPLFVSTGFTYDTFLDTQPRNGEVAYWLILEDRNGNKRKSEVFILNHAFFDEPSIYTYRSDFEFEVIVLFPTELINTGELVIYDVKGKVVARNTVSKGVKRLAIPLTNFSAGTYYVEWSGSRRCVKGITKAY